MIVSIPDPVGTRETCHCGQATVQATTVSGTERIHCGSQTPACDTNQGGDQ